MSNFVSSGTAKRLREAGFPQPEIQVGQFWYFQYSGKWTAFVITHQVASYWKMIPIGEASEGYSNFGDAGLLAPISDDILPHIPDGRLEMWEGRFSCKIDCDDQPQRFFADNFAEAAALAWLAAEMENPADLDDF